MNKKALIAVCLQALLICAALLGACGSGAATGRKVNPTPKPKSEAQAGEQKSDIIPAAIEVGGKVFDVELYDSPAVSELTALFPLTVQMQDFSRQEKTYALPQDLPAESTEKPGEIRSGDIMCWSGNTLVLFYTTFSNSYSYTRLGRVIDPTDLPKALGSKSATVTWSLKSGELRS